jgi:hypothetical protein
VSTDADDEVGRAAVALLLALLDGADDEAAQALLVRDEDPHFGAKVAYRLARGHAKALSLEGFAEDTRERIRAELLRSAGSPPDA